MHHLTGGGWGFLIRRVLEQARELFWLLALLYVPLLLGMTHIYACGAARSHLRSGFCSRSTSI